MRQIILPLIAASLALFAAGCTGPEQKLGRGINNTWELIRWGEMRRSVEQAAVLDSPETGYGYGVVSGFNRSVGRAALGIVEVVTFPLPPYSPQLTNTLAARPVFPESYKPGRISDPLFDTDTFTGFSGGDIAPMVPGSRFKVFDN